MKTETVVRLDDNQTHVECDEQTKKHAIRLAFRVTMSAHEWDWKTSEAATMAQYVLWAHQRLCAIEQCVTGDLKRTISRAVRELGDSLGSDPR